MTDRTAQHYYDRYWREGLPGWSPAGLSITPLEQHLLAGFLQPGASVLDFGCGDGAHAAPFVLSRGCDYTGVDVSGEAIALCRAKGLEAQSYSSDSALPFASNSFDRVISFEVLEHLFSPERALQELHRTLKPQGYLIGSVPNSVYLTNRLLMAAGRFSPGGSPATSLKAPWRDPHIRFFNKRSLLSVLRQTSFRDARVVGADFCLLDFPVLYRSTGFSRRLVRAGSWPLRGLGQLWPSLLSAHLYFVAQK